MLFPTPPDDDNPVDVNGCGICCGAADMGATNPGRGAPPPVENMVPAAPPVIVDC